MGEEEFTISKKAKLRLKGEVEKAKKLLSSMNEIMITVENFAPDENLNVKITRARFENLCEK